MECQGFFKNRKDPSLLSFSTSAPEYGRALCFCCVSSLIAFLLCSLASSHSSSFGSQNMLGCILHESFPAWGPLRWGCSLPHSRCPAHSYVSAQISLQSTNVFEYLPCSPCSSRCLELHQWTEQTKSPVSVDQLAISSLNSYLTPHPPQARSCPLVHDRCYWCPGYLVPVPLH